jgi:hypothetical protein
MHLGIRRFEQANTSSSISRRDTALIINRILLQRSLQTDSQSHLLWSWLRQGDSAGTKKPAAVGGSCLRLIGRHLKKLARPSLAVASFQSKTGEDERDAYADAVQTGQGWMDEGGTVVSS